MTAVDSPRQTLRNGWCVPPQHEHRQLTHAVPLDDTVAVCGARISVCGRPWLRGEDALVVVPCRVCTAALSSR